MKKLLTAVLMSLAALSSAAAVTEKQEFYRKEILENRCMELEFLPDSLGRLNQIRWKPSGRKLLLERTLTRVSVDPLYEFYRNNSFGCGENFWKNYVALRDGKSRVGRQDPDSIVFENKWYGGLPIDLRRRSVLPPDSTVITFEAEVFNRGEKPFYAALWYSLVPADAGSTILQIPAAAGKPGHILGNVNVLEHPAVISKRTGLFAPARNWAAVVYPEEKLVLAVIAPPEEFFPDGGFYTWLGEDNKIKYRSLEIILNGRDIAPGRKSVSRCHIAVFGGLRGIRDIAGTTAIDVERSDGKTALVLAPARKTAAGKMRIISGEKQYEAAVPELVPGQTHRIEIEDCGKISGILPDGCGFDLSAMKQEE